MLNLTGNKKMIWKKIVDSGFRNKSHLNKSEETISDVRGRPGRTALKQAVKLDPAASEESIQTSTTTRRGENGVTSKTAICSSK